MLSNKRLTVSLKYFILATFSWILSVIWLAYVVFMACEPALESTVRSSTLLSQVNSSLDMRLTEVMIRKGAHVFEFGLLTFLIFFSLFFTNRVSNDYSFKDTSSKVIKSENEYCIVFSLWLSTMVAFLTEYLQLYVDGRAGSVIDVLYDSVGSIFVLLIIRIIFSVQLVIRNKRNNSF